MAKAGSTEKVVREIRRGPTPSEPDERRGRRSYRRIGTAWPPAICSRLRCSRWRVSSGLVRTR